jgi:hypothetical protein
MSLTYTATLVFHIIGVIVAVGSATIVDYLHLISLRKVKLEKGLVKIYPLISNLINASLILIFITGFILVNINPELLNSPLFITKLILVLIVGSNGLYLQRIVSPQLDKCILKGTKFCTKKVLYSSAISGSISIITWYSILILSMTKNLGYSLNNFLTAYFLILLLVIGISLYIEWNAKKWRN